MDGKKTALVLGATGGIGGEVARRLLARGWTVRALHRAAAQRPAGDGIAWRQGDAMRRDDVCRAAAGVALIVHAVNPPGYRNWGELVLPMLDNSIAAARASGARILLPGTVYNYGPDAFPLLAEDASQNPRTRKGAIRVEMERRLAAAAADGSARSLVVRAGDFFGAGAANNWFSQALVKPGRPVAVVNNPGRQGVGHQWAYLPDVAETMCRLLDDEAGLADFARFHMDGHWDADGTQMVNAVRRVVLQDGGAGAARIKALPWWAMMAIAPFVPTLREMREMRYLWQQPVRLDNRRLLARLGAEPHTALDDAVRTTLRGLGCFPGGFRVGRVSAA